MKNSRKVLSIIMAALMLVSTLAFASCGDTAGNTDGAYNLPIVCGETGMNDVCGVATYGVNYYNLGNRLR